MAIANASLLDEGTAAGEAMVMCFAAAKRQRKAFFVDKDVHPQTIACLKTRASGFGIHSQAAWGVELVYCQPVLRISPSPQQDIGLTRHGKMSPDPLSMAGREVTSRTSL